MWSKYSLFNVLWLKVTNTTMLLPNLVLQYSYIFRTKLFLVEQGLSQASEQYSPVYTGLAGLDPLVLVGFPIFPLDVSLQYSPILNHSFLKSRSWKRNHLESAISYICAPPPLYKFLATGLTFSNLMVQRWIPRASHQ